MPADRIMPPENFAASGKNAARVPEGDTRAAIEKVGGRS
jgi:hypothetical protein